MTPNAQAWTLAIHAFIALALIAAASTLAWHGDIDAQAITGIFGAVIGLVGGSAGTLAVVGFQQPPPNGVKAQVTDELPRERRAP